MNSYSNSIDETLNEIYPNNHIAMIKVNYCGSISVFIVTIYNNIQLEELWKKISSSIAAYYQAHLESDFEKWNIYIIYKCKSDINISLIYKIENDKFSSRKIVHIMSKNDIDDEIMNNNIVTKYITNRDLELPIVNKISKPEKYNSNTKIWDYINKGKIRPNKNSVKEIENVLEQIEIALQDEN